MDQEERSLVFSEMREAATRARRARDAMPETVTLEIDLSDIQNLLHVLRNPYGWSENTARAARLVAANYIEAILKRAEENGKGFLERVEKAEREKDAAVGELKSLKQAILSRLCD